MARTDVPRATWWPPWKTARSRTRKVPRAKRAGRRPRRFFLCKNGTGGTLSETTLTLTDVSSKTGWFTDRPYRGSGQMSTERFIALWDEGGTFADDPPDADFTCTVDSEVVNYVVELTSPGMVGEDLSYAVTAVADTVLPETTITCDGASHAFLDALFWNCDAAEGRGWECDCTPGENQCDSAFTCVWDPCETCEPCPASTVCGPCFSNYADACYPGTGGGVVFLSVAVVLRVAAVWRLVKSDRTGAVPLSRAF